MKRTMLLIIFMLAACTLVAQETAEVDRLIDRGIRYERENDLTGAITTFRQILVIDPDNTMIKIRLAKVLSWKNEFDQALVILNDILVDNPREPEALFRKAQILSWQGRYGESLSVFELYLEEKPDDPDALLGIARVSFWSGKNTEAVALFQQAIAAGAYEIEARVELGKVYLAMGKKENAKTEFERVLELAPENAEAARFLKGIRIQKTYEVMPLGFRWNIYPDATFSVTATSFLIYHLKQSWDFTLQHEDACIRGIHDHTILAETVFRGIRNTYIRGGLAHAFDPTYLPEWKTDLGFNYSFPHLFGVGISLQSDIFETEALWKIIPELRRDFTDISYISLKYNRYLYTTGYSTGSFEILLNAEYYNRNDLFVKAVYGGDIEVRDKSRRVFDFAAGITYSFTENLESSISYGRIETPYGKSHEISYQSVIKW